MASTSGSNYYSQYYQQPGSYTQQGIYSVSGQPYSYNYNQPNQAYQQTSQANTQPLLPQPPLPPEDKPPPPPAPELPNDEPKSTIQSNAQIPQGTSCYSGPQHWPQGNPQWPQSSTIQSWGAWAPPNYQWGWGAWPQPSPWLPTPGQSAWAGAWPNYQVPVPTQPPKSPGTPPLPNEETVSMSLNDDSSLSKDSSSLPANQATNCRDFSNDVAVQSDHRNSQNSTQTAITSGHKHNREEGSEDDVTGEKRLRQDNDEPPKENQECSSKEGASKWPPKMKEYVTRAFNACSNEKDREYVHHVLDEELNRLFSENKQWNIDWDSYPLPTERIHKARSSSRWDTPPPSELVSEATPTIASSVSRRGKGGLLGDRPALNQGGHGIGRGSLVGESGAVGRGRGKKRRGKKGKKWSMFSVNEEPSAEDKKRLNERVQRFGKQGSAEGNKNIKKKISIDELLKRTLTSGGDDGLVYWQDSSLAGTCKSLEKRYLRLTSAPEPSTVRPLSVLKLSLKHVCDKWKANRDYYYACEQLKSIRQDLTIQGIRDDFTVCVYETHGRMALENGDHQEFNQCQTQLKSLYSEGLAGAQSEFLAYRIIYYILIENSADMSSTLLKLSPDLKSTPCVAHALQVWTAWSLGNYHQLFSLYESAPYLSRQLMDMFIERERKRAFQAMIKAYRPSLTVDYISAQLKFNSRDECLEFLCSLDVVLDHTHSTIDCKATTGKLT